MSQVRSVPSLTDSPPTKPASISSSSPNSEQSVKNSRGGWESVFRDAFGGIFAEMLSTTFLKFASHLTETLADPRKVSHMKKTMRIHLGYGGEYGCGMGATEGKGVHYGYPGPSVRSAGDFSLSHYRISNDKRKKNEKKENLMYSKLVINGFPKYAHIIRVWKTVIRGFYLYGDDHEGFSSAIKRCFSHSIEESICDYKNIIMNTSRQADIVTAKVTIPWNEKIFENRFPKTWCRVKKIKRFTLKMMEETGNYVFATMVVNQKGISIYGMIYQDKFCLCKIVMRKQTPKSTKKVPLHIPLANLNGRGPRTIDVNHLTELTIQSRGEMSISAVFGMATFNLPWIQTQIKIFPKSMGGVSVLMKVLEIQERSMAERMFSMILPFKQLRELALKFYDVRLNLGKSSLSRNPIRSDTETHIVTSNTKKMKDTFLITVDGLVRMPPLPSCLVKILSDIINDSWEERFLILRDTCRTFGMDLRAMHKEQMSAIHKPNRPIATIGVYLQDEKNDEKIDRNAKEPREK